MMTLAPKSPSGTPSNQAANTTSESMSPGTPWGFTSRRGTNKVRNFLLSRRAAPLGIDLPHMRFVESSASGAPHSSHALPFLYFLRGAVPELFFFPL